MRTKLTIGAIIVLALILRLLYFRDSLTFFYDTARDATEALQIFKGDPLKILGPQTDFAGLHHGPLYWYMTAPFYFFSGGNIWIVRLFLILLNILALYFIFDLTKSLFKNKTIALLSTFLYAISFEAIQYARWMSNPTPALLTIIISFWSLYKLMEGKKWAFVTLLISWGLSIQFQLFMLYQITVFTLIWVSNKGLSLPKLPIKIYLLGFIGFLLTISTFLIAEIKFNFQGTKALFTFFGTQTLFGQSFVNMIQGYFDRVVNIFFLNIWGLNLFLAGIMTLITLIFAYSEYKKGHFKKELLFLGIWVFSPIVINFFTGPQANFITLGALGGAVILTAFFLYQLKLKNALLFGVLISAIFLGNLNLVISKNKQGEVLFAVQSKMLLGDELKVIDWIYQQSGGNPFKLNTITAPLFINTTWSYLFDWYGRSKYGYMPIWWGETQVDVPGSYIKFSPDQNTDLEFLIIEPLASSDDSYTKAVKLLENSRSEATSREKIGNFLVERRKITRSRIFTSQDVSYTVLHTDLRELQKVE